METFQSPSEAHGCVCIALIRTLPKVFEAALNQAITRADVKEDSKDYYVKYSFHPLQLSEHLIATLASFHKDPNFRPPPLFSCNAMVQSGRVDLLMHPLTQKYLEMKWQAYGMYVHLFNLFIYLLFLGMVTMFAAGVLGNERKKSNFATDLMMNATFFESENDTSTIETQTKIYDTYSILLALGILISSILGILKELFLLYQQKFKYIVDVLHFVEWILYSTSICMVLPILSCQVYGEQQYNSAAIAVLSAWFTLLLYFQRFDLIGIYIVMFLEILNTLLKVLAVFSVLIVAFGLAFYILLSHGNHLAFSNVPLTLVRTFSMMLGEIDFMNSFIYPFYGTRPQSSGGTSSVLPNVPGTDIDLRFPKTTFVILIVFMILMPILLMNLLIGLAVGDIESVKKNAQLKRIAMQVELHSNLESKLPTCLIKKVNKQECIEYPNAKSCNTENSLIYKFLNAIDVFGPFADQSRNDFECPESMNDEFFLDELDNQEKRYKDIQSQLDQQLKLLKLIMQKMEIQHEADETDEGVSLEELKNRPLKQIRRWTSASSTSSRKMIKSE